MLDLPDDLADLWRDLPPLGPWVDDAACGSLGLPEVFTSTTKPAADELAVAEKVCRKCPVKQECGSYAASTPVHGFWAGTWQTGRTVRHEAA